jgi:hypothetical protein
MTIDEIMQALKVENWQGSDNVPCFDSNYTKKPVGELGIMSVDSERLFNDLSPEQRQRYASRDENGILTLDLWSSIYQYYLDPINDWVLVSRLNMFSAKLSYNPDYIDYNEYLINVATGTVFVDYGVYTKDTHELMKALVDIMDTIKEHELQQVTSLKKERYSEVWATFTKSKKTLNRASNQPSIIP